MVNDRNREIGAFIPAPDDDMIICRCEEVTKGEIRKAVHEGMYTITEIRRYLRTGMGLCQGQTCAKLVAVILLMKTFLMYWLSSKLYQSIVSPSMSIKHGLSLKP